jgi:hypothetical protein
MSTYTEDHLVEQPAIQLMQRELGWDVVNCYDEWSGGVSNQGRDTAARRHSHFLLDDRSNLRLAGFRFPAYLDSMKTTIDIPDAALADAMRFTGAKTKREAVVKALEAYNRQQRVNDLVASFGTWNIATNDEIEAGDLAEIAARQGESKTRATAKR